MPPSDQSEEWIQSDWLTLPRQNLLPAEAEAFLDYLFGNVAIKPKRLTLRETAGVARYLRALTLQIPARYDHELVTRVADLICLTLLDRGQIRIATKRQVLDFLAAHRGTYLASFDMERMVQVVGGRPEPAGQEAAFRPPQLMGKARSVRGQNRTHLQDDLTERVYVAYHVLRRAGVKNVRRRIANALNRLGLQTGAKPGTSGNWGSAEVMERVRQFGDRLLHQHRVLPRPDRQRRVERLRATQVDEWIHGFHCMAGVKSCVPERARR